MDIVATGLSGLVGSKFSQMYAKKYTFSNLDLTNGVDITKADDVMRAIEKSSSPVVIHLAAFTDVNKAFEQTGDKTGLCYAVNVLGTQNIADACQKTGKHLIHVSTSFVFDGDNDTRILIKSYIDDYNYYLKYKENIIDHGWIIYLDHSCEEWIIGNIGEAEKMRDDIEKAIEYMKANP